MKLKQEPIGIGQNLRKLRQDAGYSQSQVAALLCERGVYMTTDIYKKIEQNKYNIRISELNALKELLTMERAAPVAAMTMTTRDIIITIITQMRYLQAGVRKPSVNTAVKRLKRF